MSKASGHLDVVYGVGATKAGTSWLYRYLASHPECAMSYPKELHVFDRLDGVYNVDQREVAMRELSRVERRALDVEGGDLEELRMRAKALHRYIAYLESGAEDDATYVDFLTGGCEGKKLVGDLTPSYGLVSTSMLERMLNAAPVTKFVLILRDPVARLWSNIRMDASRQAKRRDGNPARIAARLVENVTAGEAKQLAVRSDYSGILERLSQAIPAKRLFVEFYERLFSDAAIKRLCAFLDIKYVAASFKTRVHEGSRMALPDAARAQLQSYLAPQYAAVAARFDDLPSAWQKNMVGTS